MQQYKQSGNRKEAGGLTHSYVILDRVVWGMSALLGRMKATGNWRALLAEYREDGPASTELGELEVEWRRSRSSTAAS